MGLSYFFVLSVLLYSGIQKLCVMNTLKNNVQLIGNLGQDVELITFDSGMHKANMRLATNDYYKNNDGEKVQQTEWHNLIAWGKRAETMSKLLKKGNEIAVQGKLTHRSYQDKDGVTRYTSEVVVQEFLKITKEDLPF